MEPWKNKKMIESANLKFKCSSFIISLFTFILTFKGYVYEMMV